MKQTDGLTASITKSCENQGCSNNINGGRRKYCSTQCAKESHQRIIRDWQSQNKARININSNNYYHRKKGTIPKEQTEMLDPIACYCGRFFTPTEEGQIYCCEECEIKDME